MRSEKLQVRSCPDLALRDGLIRKPTSLFELTIELANIRTGVSSLGQLRIVSNKLPICDARSR
jgi:hypothetical protein